MNKAIASTTMMCGKRGSRGGTDGYKKVLPSIPIHMRSSLLRSNVLTKLPNPASTTFRGTSFEIKAQSLLQSHLSMSMTRVGGSGDDGIDLQGWWWLPSQLKLKRRLESGTDHQRFRVLAQCKAEKKTFGSKYVREMEGVLSRFMHTKPPPAFPFVALLISESAFTPPTLKRAMSSTVPFLLIHLPPNEYNTIGSALWNPALGSESGLLEGQVDLRWERTVDGDGRPGLWYARQRLENWTPPE